HTNVVALPAARVTGPGGSGPLTNAASPAPGPAKTVAVMPLTLTPPVFVTVNAIVSHCPIELMGRAIAPAARETPFTFVAGCSVRYSVPSADWVADARFVSTVPVGKPGARPTWNETRPDFPGDTRAITHRRNSGV